MALRTASGLRAGSSARRAAPGSRRPAVRAAALFGFGKREDTSDKDEQFRIQQELLEKRRSGQLIREAGERRKKVSETLAARKAERLAEREALGRGEMPETLSKWKPYKKKEDAEGTGGIIVPLNPLGMRMYDEGERFDLRSPYSDDGWVDPEETDAFAGFKNIGKKLLNLTGRRQEEGPRKPIIWASQWEKTKGQKKGDGK